MAAATARGTSDACIVAWPLSLERCRSLQAVRLGHHIRVLRSKFGGPQRMPAVVASLPAAPAVLSLG